MKKILVPCDFVKPATDAFRFALDIAKQSKGVVHLLHVVELPILNDTVLMPVLNFEEQLLKDLSENADKKFGKLITRFGKPGVKCIHEVQFGTVSKMILDYASDNSIDLIIMGSHGASGLKEMFIGSNAEKIVRQSTVPVLITKNYYRGSIKNIVFPNALNTDSQKDLIKNVKELQAFFKAKLHVLWVNTPVNFTSDVVTNQRLQAFVKKHGLRNSTINVFNHTDEESGIVEFSNQIKANLIAMGTRGRTGIGRIINGSLAENIVNHSKGPVWTFRLQNE